MNKSFMILLSVAFVDSGASQSGSLSEAGQIIVETLRYVHEDRGGKIGTPNIELKVDPIVFQNRGLGSTVDGAGARHPEQVLARVRQVSGVAVVTSERARQCAANAPSDCMNKGYSIVLNLGNPVINGDSAHVDFLIQISRTLTTDDSLRYAGGRAAATRIRAHRSSGSIARVLLVKSPTGWTASRMIYLAQS